MRRAGMWTVLLNPMPELFCSHFGNCATQVLPSSTPHIFFVFCLRALHLATATTLLSCEGSRGER